jgi:hypothetical protein
MPAALMDLEWDEVEEWLDQAEWTAKAASGEKVDR